MGINSFSTFVKNMLAGIGVNEGFTNHSLKVTTVNTLADHGFSDSNIMRSTGHRSATVSGYRRSVNIDRMSEALSAPATAASAAIVVEESSNARKSKDNRTYSSPLSSQEKEMCSEAVASCGDSLFIDEFSDNG